MGNRNRKKTKKQKNSCMAHEQISTAKGKKSKDKKEKLKRWQKALTVCALASIVMELVFQIDDFDGMLWLEVTAKLLYSATVIYYAWFSMYKPSVLCSAFCTVFATVGAWLPVLNVDDRLCTLFRCVSLVALAALLVYVLLKQSDSMLCDMIAVVLILAPTCFVGIVRSGYTVTIDGLFQDTVFYIIMAAVLLGGIATYFVVKPMTVKNKAVKEAYEHERGLLVFLCLTVALCTLLIISPVADGLNYALDFSQPQSYRTVIRDKNETMRSNSHTYSICVRIEGEEIWLEVGADIYTDFEKGDSVNVDKYNGFFNEPYLIMKK